MGVRGHVRIVEPKYGKCALSAWVQDYAKDYLYAEDIEIFVSGGEDSWEIEITDKLRDIAKRLASGELREDFNSYLCEDMRDNAYDTDFGKLLQEGIAAADSNNETHITIDWF